MTPEELFDLFGKFGPIRYFNAHNTLLLDLLFRSAPRQSLTNDGSQIRQGINNSTKGTAFVVYEDVMDAKSACDKLNGFNFQNRYLVGTCQFPKYGYFNVSYRFTANGYGRFLDG